MTTAQSCHTGSGWQLPVGLCSVMTETAASADKGLPLAWPHVAVATSYQTQTSGPSEAPSQVPAHSIGGFPGRGFPVVVVAIVQQAGEWGGSASTPCAQQGC